MIISITFYFLIGLIFAIYINWRYPDDLIVIKVEYINTYTYFLYLISTILFFPLLAIYFLYKKVIKTDIV